MAATRDGGRRLSRDAPTPAEACHVSTDSPKDRSPVQRRPAGARAVPEEDRPVQPTPTSAAPPVDAHRCVEGSGEPPDNDEAVVASIRSIQCADRQRLEKSVAGLLETQRARIEYAESRRGSLATVGGVLLAAGFTGLLAVGKTDDWNYFPLWLGLVSVAGSLVLFGALVIGIYGWQTNWSYPFKKVSKTWKHFYRDAIPQADDPPAPWHSRQSTTFKVASERGFAAGRPGFIQRTLTLSDPAISLAQDIEQSYLLHWNEMYKNRFLTDLRKVLVRGIVCSLVVGAIGFIVGAATDRQRFDDHGRQPAAAGSNR